MPPERNRSRRWRFFSDPPPPTAEPGRRGTELQLDQPHHVERLPL
jgi:hypothetical protein